MTLTIHKFGGASLADADAVRHVAAIVAGQRPTAMVLVVSAMAGVTDALLEIAGRARDADARSVDEGIAALRQRHIAIARALVSDPKERRALITLLEQSFDELQHVAQGLVVLRELTPRTSDFIVARGERLSARIVTAALRRSGLSARFVDATDVVRTDGTFGSAAPDLALTDRAARAILRPLLRRRVIPVVPGYLGATPDRQVATLGRGGSDLSATILGRALGARRVNLWKDVPGLLTADPRIVPDARVIPQLNAREAAELAYYGAKVLHPRALVPLAGRRIPVFVRPFAEPQSPGTEVSSRRTLMRYPVKALSAVRGQALMTIAGNGMLGVPGIAARAFTALHHEGISVSLISQASSEHSICFSVPSDSAKRARVSLERAFQSEIARREIDGVEMRAGMATLAVVGLGMAGVPGIAAKVFSALSAGEINVIAIAQGSSELNISAVIDEQDVPNALRRVHAAFQLSKIGGGAVARPERVDVVLLGYGQIGRELGAMIARSRSNGVSLRVVGVVDRSGMLFDANGLSARRLAQLAAAKRERMALARIEGGRALTALAAVQEIARHALANPILVDLTADDTGDVLESALTAGMDLVLANKRLLAGPQARAQHIARLAEQHGRRILHETTVGAGLPIIDTYYKLVDSGDKVYRIEGCPSGTLGYLFGEMGRGKSFSESLRGAMAKGYTEPDPRDDLSGMDVGRKALILGRLLGYAGELDDVDVESLVPHGAARLPLAEFLRRLEEWDEAWRERVRAAAAQGGVLRYRCTVTRRSVTVGLLVVDRSSSMASLNGTDNQFIFTTARYKTSPLVITGPGAGPAVTAAGVLNDVLKLAGA